MFSPVDKFSGNLFQTFSKASVSFASIYIVTGLRCLAYVRRLFSKGCLSCLTSELSLECGSVQFTSSNYSELLRSKHAVRSWFVLLMVIREMHGSKPGFELCKMNWGVSNTAGTKGLGGSQWNEPGNWGVKSSNPSPSIRTLVLISKRLNHLTSECFNMVIEIILI